MPGLWTLDQQNFRAGDVGLSCNRDFADWWIRFAERRRYGRKSEEARWNHAFLLVSDDGKLIQATPHGIERNDLHEYIDTDLAVLRPPYAPTRAQDAIRAMEEMVGDKYGWVTIACEALALLTQTKLRFGLSGQEICSGAVSYALTEAGLDVGLDMEWNTPADLMHYGIDQQWAWISRRA